MKHRPLPFARVARAGRTALFAISIAVLAGCLGTQTGRPDERGPRAIEERGRSDTVQAVHWRQIYLGSPPRPRLAGYLRTVTSRGALQGTRFVYDADFVLIGRVSPRGQTFRIARNGEERDEGTYALETGLQLMFRQEHTTPVALRPMPAPRG